MDAMNPPAAQHRLQRWKRGQESLVLALWGWGFWEGGSLMGETKKNPALKSKEKTGVLTD